MWPIVCIVCSVLPYALGDFGLLHESQILSLTAQVTIEEGGNEAVDVLSLRNLSGRWKAVSGEEDGKEIPLDELSDCWVEFSGGRMYGSTFQYALTNAAGETKVSGIRKVGLPVTVNSDRTPTELDIEIGFRGRQTITPFGTWRKGKPILYKCIYRCVDDQLTICYGGTDERPDKFSTAGNKFRLIKFNRDENLNGAAPEETK
jgi:uncharacterized protein (TIGR03067 family)